MTALPPGGTIGILGGGQLGRMLAIAAAQLGYRCHIYAPEAKSVAAEVARDWTRADYDDGEALQAFAAACDVVTYEFENVPVDPLGLIAGSVPLRPGPKALEVAQNRADEKAFARDCGARPADYAVVETPADLDDSIARIGTPSVLKTIRFGYDGKGQIRLNGGENGDAVWAELGRQPAVLEAFVEFSHEFSIILVRGIDGEIRLWDVPENRHDDGILARSTVPAADEIIAQVETAGAQARAIAEALDYVGVMTCEFFATPAGPVFNEMAPRVHNSGHWTIEGAVTSQFENHIRAICGLPLGDTALAAPRVEMRNLIGGDAAEWQAALDDASSHLHLYGKAESRPGRKMGHVTRLIRA